VSDSAAVYAASARERRDIAEGVDVRHHIVAEAPLESGRLLEVYVGEVSAHLRETLVGDVLYSQLAFGLGEGEPELPPERVPLLRRPEFRHRP
jgi:hypothetical protein